MSTVSEEEVTIPTMKLFIDAKLSLTSKEENLHIANKIILADGNVSSSRFCIKNNGSQISYNFLSESIIKNIYAYLKSRGYV